MNAKQAKDFLVQQTAEQADLDGLPLSELEKRMMYFTESDASCENPVQLNDEFEAQYDTAEYESKLSRLLHRSRDRLKKEDAEKVRRWAEAIRTLRKGDHYVLVLWDIKAPSDLKPVGGLWTRDSFKLLGAGVLGAACVGVVSFLAAKYDITFNHLRKYLPAPTPLVGFSLYVGLFLIGVGALYLFNWAYIAWAERRNKRDGEEE
ncbi:MAG TPA: hypothetical protein VGI46_00550 [Candidatus Acidoferrum sp.]|jgi:hypothetical protein